MTLPPTTETIFVFSVWERITPREEVEIGKDIIGSVQIDIRKNTIIDVYINRKTILFVQYNL